MAGLGHALTVPPHGQQLPGRPRLYSVPFRGRGHGKRLRKQPKAKLTREQKKALKWAQRNPESPITQGPGGSITIGGGGDNNTVLVGVAMNEVGPITVGADVRMHHCNITTGTTVTINDGAQLYNTRVTLPATPITLDANTIRLDAGTAATDYEPIRIEGTALGRPATTFFDNVTTATNDYTVTTIGTNVILNTDINIVGTTETIVQDWATWNQNDYTVVGNNNALWVNDRKYRQQYREVSRSPDACWAGMQGRGHQADLWYNPNDQLQRRRRDLAAEANRAIQRREEAARYEREAEQRRILEAERVQLRAVAKDRSYLLLHNHLSEEQLAMLENESRFLIEVNSGKVYEIRRGIHQNIYRLDGEGRIVEQLCAAPRGDVPEGDAMLAQMLHLMTNEEAFRQVANRWNIEDHRRGQEDRRLPLRVAA